MSLSPFLRNPCTDIAPNVINQQDFGKCATLELKTMECLEAYGLQRGALKCADLLHDFDECVHKTKQMKRVFVS